MIQSWHQRTWQLLREALAAQQLPHAILIDGPPSIGKREVADALIGAALCDAPVGEGACGNCRACKLLAAGNHPDRVEVGLGLTREGKQRREIVVDQIRSLSARLAKTSQFGGLQMALVAPADALNTSAANALLKTLEEPSPASVLILVAGASWRLPATIRSRCRHYPLLPPDRETALAWLAERGATGDAASTALDVSGGVPAAALALLDKEPARNRHRQVHADLDALLHGRGNAHAVATAWADDEPAERLAIAARLMARRAAQAGENGSHDSLKACTDAFGRFNRTRELLRGPLKPVWALFEVLQPLALAAKAAGTKPR